MKRLNQQDYWDLTSETSITKQCKLQHNPFSLHLFRPQISAVINLQNKSDNHGQKLILNKHQVCIKIAFGERIMDLLVSKQVPF